jgi:hypothetical protein
MRMRGREQAHPMHNEKACRRLACRLILFVISSKKVESSRRAIAGEQAC